MKIHEIQTRKGLNMCLLTFLICNFADEKI